MFIGITGKSGSGKSTLAKLYEENGYTRVSIDEIGHKVIEEHQSELEKVFGTSNRKKLGDLIFNDRHKYKELSNYCWRFMQEKIDNIIKDKKNVVFDFLLLPHTKYFNMCDCKILVKSNFFKRMFRVLKRDKISLRYFLLREKNSIDFKEKDFDVIINEFRYKKV